MSNAAFTGEDRDRIEIEVVYPHPVASVWRALTDADALARWLIGDTPAANSRDSIRAIRRAFPWL